MITQNIDRIVTKKDFEGRQTIAVTSMFHTIQGEGPYAGYPSVFVRFAGCNFGDKQDHCSWCDTFFALDKATPYTVDALVSEVAALKKNNKDILVITGGEPTLQPLLFDFIAAASKHFRAIQIESNGTQAYFFAQVTDLKELVARNGSTLCTVVSPKASEKAGRYGKLSNTVLANADCLKFVVSADPTSPHHKVPDWACTVNTEAVVYISPMAEYKKPYAGEVSSIWDTELIDSERTSKNYAYAAQYSMTSGFLLSLQTHLFTSIP
jgi:organic radical activating enzyme